MWGIQQRLNRDPFVRQTTCRPLRSAKIVCESIQDPARPSQHLTPPILITSKSQAASFKLVLADCLDQALKTANILVQLCYYELPLTYGHFEATAGNGAVTK